MTPLEIISLVKQMRDSQKRWPGHPQQASIETMALEMKVDEALEPWLEYMRAVAINESDLIGLDAGVPVCGQ